MKIKVAQETEFSRDEDGYVMIKQAQGEVRLTPTQIESLLKWLADGNGLNSIADWNGGVAKEKL